MGEVDKFVIFKCEIFSGIEVSKIITIGSFLSELFKENWGGAFLDHHVDPPPLHSTYRAGH